MLIINKLILKIILIKDYYLNIPLNNLKLNNQNLSQKRKISQIILIILLYLSGLYFIIILFYTGFKYINLLILIISINSILQIILASVILFYTIKNKSSRSICTSIISIIICILDGVYHILLFLGVIGGILTNLVFAILVISYDIFIFIFNSSCNCGKCLD